MEFCSIEAQGLLQDLYKLNKLVLCLHDFQQGRSYSKTVQFSPDLQRRHLAEASSPSDDGPFDAEDLN